MTVSVDQTIAACYVAFFGRSPDQQGLQFWKAAAQNSNLSGIALTENIAAGFANNPSFAATYGTYGNSAFVTAIYQNIGGTAPDAAGLAYWTNLLNNGESRAQVVADFVHGVLNMSVDAINAEVTAGTITQAEATAALQRQAYLTNRSNVALSYTQALGAGSNMATSTNQNDLASLAKDPAYVASQAILNGVTADPASVTAAKTFLSGSPTTTAVIATFGGNFVGSTYTLTTGPNNVQATGGNSVINAVVGTTGGTNDTLHNLDSIAAKGTGNTLNIIDQGLSGSGLIPTINVSGVQTANIQSATAASVNTSNWTGLNNLNVSASTGADVIKAAGTTAVNVTNTLATGAAAAPSLNTTVDGGSTVTVNATGASSGANVVIGNVIVGGTTPPTGAVNVTVAQTSGVTGTTFGNVAATGAAAVTVNATENAGFATTAVEAGTINATGGATGVVTVNNTTNVTDAAAHTIVGAAVVATGGSSIVVNDTVTASAAADATALASAQDGAVTVIDGGTATSVVVNQTVTAAVAAKAAQLASAGTPGAAGGPGFSAGAATPATPATAGVPGVVAVTANTVAVGGVGTTNLAGALVSNASNTITSVSLDNYGANSFINSTVLNSVTLAGSGTGGLTIENLGATPFTTLGVNLNGFTDTTGLTIASTDTTGDVKTLNVTTGGATASTLGAITDTALTTLNVSGTQTLNVTTALGNSVKALTVTGGAGFSGDISGTQITSFAPTSSGAITATLNGATQSFTGSTGQDIITISADAAKAITGGSATNNEIVLNGDAATFTGAGAKTVTNVTGFTTLGVSGNTAATAEVYNMAVLKGFNAIDLKAIAAGTGSDSFTNVASGTTLTIEATSASTGGTVAAVEGATAAAVLYQVANATGASDSLNLTLGTSQTNGISVGGAAGGLMLEDANAVGIGTLNVVSNGTATGTTVNTIPVLIDNGLANLNVSGAHGLTITALNEQTTQATSFAINNTSGGAVTVGTFTDANLGSLTFSGTGNSSVGTLAGVTGHILTIANTGTGTASVGTFNADTSLTTLNLNGNVALNADAPGGPAPAAAAATGATTGVTVSGATDNAHVNLTLTGGALAGVTDSITLGNGNNLITDKTTVGNVNITVGTGSNLIDVHTGTGAGTYNITLGAHTAATGPDAIVVSASGTTAAGAANTVITGAVAGDQINFGAIVGETVVTLTAAQQTAITAASTLSAAAALAFADANVAGNVASFQYGGNTYVLEHTAAGAQVAADSLIELVGTHTLTAGAVTAGHVVLAS
ncbi:beta strand repeat-containing protein [Paraburkholderia sp. BR10954]|uniref:beta strand repeat-containing protein n=1 Tax=Paraburkholderia sp. BR10954 TaxID=3236995 RepID=UPI0034D2E4B3